MECGCCCCESLAMWTHLELLKVGVLRQEELNGKMPAGKTTNDTQENSVKLGGPALFPRMTFSHFDLLWNSTSLNMARFLAWS